MKNLEMHKLHVLTGYANMHDSMWEESNITTLCLLLYDLIGQQFPGTSIIRIGSINRWMCRNVKPCEPPWRVLSIRETQRITAS